ncbi:hypothetical protein [Methylobacterium radiotolerans]|uniref:hypothetical protein n=1 Tax=Methylobacterium radiotolerans TaxID=31998 RepID=UPI000B77ED7F|nr:hypothetical protein [Methylobacterium radiotolerans]OXE38351.1 hypothetical protein CCS92_29810 [Methylobacterium radiotolerans]
MALKIFSYAMIGAFLGGLDMSVFVSAGVLIVLCAPEPVRWMSRRQASEAHTAALQAHPA